MRKHNCRMLGTLPHVLSDSVGFLWHVLHLMALGYARLVADKAHASMHAHGGGQSLSQWLWHRSALQVLIGRALLHLVLLAHMGWPCWLVVVTHWYGLVKCGCGCMDRVQIPCPYTGPSLCKTCLSMPMQLEMSLRALPGYQLRPDYLMKI